jgi:hypothetical protein
VSHTSCSTPCTLQHTSWPYRAAADACAHPTLPYPTTKRAVLPLARRAGGRAHGRGGGQVPRVRGRARRPPGHLRRAAGAGARRVFTPATLPTSADQCATPSCARRQRRTRPHTPRWRCSGRLARSLAAPALARGSLSACQTAPVIAQPRQSARRPLACHTHGSPRSCSVPETRRQAQQASSTGRRRASAGPAHTRARAAQVGASQAHFEALKAAHRDVAGRTRALADGCGRLVAEEEALAEFAGARVRGW